MSTITTDLTSQIIQENKDYTFFSWTAQNPVKPIPIQSAEGVYLHTTDGRKILDFSSQLMNVNIGHGRREVIEAINAQSSDLTYVAPGFATEARGKLGARLAEITPGNLKKTFFTNSGAEAIENAIKLARLVTGRHKIITNYRSYHGSTLGAISAGGDPRKLQVDISQAPNFVHVENPYYYRCPWYSTSMEECGERALENLHQVIKYEGPGNIAAIMMEGESGTSGCIKYPPFYLREVKKLCEDYDILFIADEVMSGFCRTGKWFGVDHHEIVPDIMCVAKGLTAGYIPLGGIIVSDTIAAQFDENYFPIGLTYSSHAVACAAGLAVLDIYEKDALAERAVTMGSYIDQQMDQLMQSHPTIGDWRNTGMLGCIELVRNRETKEPLSHWNTGFSEDMLKVKNKLSELGMFTFVKWNFIFVAPPLTITKDEVDQGIDILDQAIGEVTS